MVQLQTLCMHKLKAGASNSISTIVVLYLQICKLCSTNLYPQILN